VELHVGASRFGSETSFSYPGPARLFHKTYDSNISRLAFQASLSGTSVTAATIASRWTVRRSLLDLEGHHEGRPSACRGSRRHHRSCPLRFLRHSDGIARRRLDEPQRTLKL
jgi:hypothetical protein